MRSGHCSCPPGYSCYRETTDGSGCVKPVEAPPAACWIFSCVVELDLTFDLPADVLSNMSANGPAAKTALETAIATSLTNASNNTPLTVRADQIAFTALSYNGTNISRRLTDVETDEVFSDSAALMRRLQTATNYSLEANCSVTSPTSDVTSDFATSVVGVVQGWQSNSTALRGALAAELSNPLPIVVGASDIGAPTVATTIPTPSPVWAPTPNPTPIPRRRGTNYDASGRLPRRRRTHYNPHARR
jgi:hypothetical protein